MGKIIHRWFGGGVGKETIVETGRRFHPGKVTGDVISHNPEKGVPATSASKRRKHAYTSEESLRGQSCYGGKGSAGAMVSQGAFLDGKGSDREGKPSRDKGKNSIRVPWGRFISLEK